MFYRYRFFKSLVVPSLFAAVLILAAPALARRGADDYYPHAWSNTGVVIASTVVSGEWQWFSWLGRSALHHDYEHGSGHWYALPHERHSSRPEWRGSDDSRHDGYHDDRGGRRGDDDRRGHGNDDRGRRRSDDDNSGRGGRRRGGRR